MENGKDHTRKCVAVLSEKFSQVIEERYAVAENSNPANQVMSGTGVVNAENLKGLETRTKLLEILNEKGLEQKENLPSGPKELKMRNEKEGIMKNETESTTNKKEKAVHPKMKVQKRKLTRKKKGPMKQKMPVVPVLKSKHWRRYCVKKH